MQCEILILDSATTQPWIFNYHIEQNNDYNIQL